VDVPESGTFPNGYIFTGTSHRTILCVILTKCVSRSMMGGRVRRMCLLRKGFQLNGFGISDDVGLVGDYSFVA
jgi:hypothetical protein